MLAQRILITGANGFVGKHLCAYFASKEYLVIAVVRDKAKISDIINQYSNNIMTIECPDIADLSCIEQTLQAGDIVIHLAAKVHVLHDNAKDLDGGYTRINSVGSKRLAELAKNKKASQFVFLSSVHVHGAQTNGIPFSETDVMHPFCSSYAKSKYEAENVIKNIFNNSQTTCTIIRPPLIYGKNVKGNFLQLVNIIQKGIPLPFRSLKKQRHFIYIKNLISAIEAVIENPKISNQQVFLVSDDESVSTSELISEIAKVTRSKLRLLYFPKSLLYFLFLSIGKSDQLKKLSCELLINNQKIKETLHWKPLYTFQQGIAESFFDEKGRK